MPPRFIIELVHDIYNLQMYFYIYIYIYFCAGVRMCDLKPTFIKLRGRQEGKYIAHFARVAHYTMRLST